MGSAQRDGRGPIRVGIVDDHPVFRLGLKRALERERDLDISWELNTATNLEATMKKSPVDVLLIDYYLGPGQDGASATRQVTERWPEVKVAVMSASVDGRVSAASTRAGAQAFIAKSMPVSEMVESIRQLASNGRKTQRRTGSRADSPARVNGLSRRQRQVLEQLRLGLTNREIAGRLGVSVATVNKHVHEVLIALNVRNRTEAAAAAAAATR